MNKKKIREQFRNDVFTRDKNKCAMCGETGLLDAHHITNREEMPNGGYVKENGISVCKACHLKAEEYHQTGKADIGWYPADLYLKIDSSLDKAIKASEKLCSTSNTKK